MAGVVVLLCYLGGLVHEAVQPASPPAFARVASWLQAHHLRYGLGGYWESSIVTVQTDGQVKVRALLKATLAPLEDLPIDTDILVVPPDLREAAREAAPPGTPSPGFGNPQAVAYDSKREQILVPN